MADLGRSLVHAVSAGDSDEIMKLLEAKADANYENMQGHTALMKVLSTASTPSSPHNKALGTGDHHLE